MITYQRIIECVQQMHFYIENRKFPRYYSHFIFLFVEVQLTLLNLYDTADALVSERYPVTIVLREYAGY